MKKTIFKDSLFYWLLISLLFITLIWNFYTLLTGVLVSLIPITIQLIIIYLILTKNKHTKIGIKIWSLILIVGPSLSFFGKLLKIIIGDNFQPMTIDMIQNLIMLIIGIFIYTYNQNTVEVVLKNNP